MRGVRLAATSALLALSSCALVACSSDSSPTSGSPASPIGAGDHSATSVTLTEVAGAGAKLARPRDLDFNPLVPGELWVVNDGDDSVVIVHDATGSTPAPERRYDVAASHFMPFPSSIAFGAAGTTFGKPGTFATCGESRNEYHGQAPANDFMGPALWSSDPSVFAKTNPHELGSHIDMLHCSPLCMGITHDHDNVYWAVSGLAGSIVRYDFGKDHDIGQDDHSDGTARQYAAGQLRYVQGIPSHVTFDRKSNKLYVADTGNHRILELDTTQGTPGGALPVLEPMKEHVKMTNVALAELVSADSGELQAPSGIELRDDILYVSDNANGRISAFDLTGKRVNYLDTGLPPRALAGMVFGPDGKLYLVDMTSDRVLRVDPR